VETVKTNEYNYATIIPRVDASMPNPANTLTKIAQNPIAKIKTVVTATLLALATKPKKEAISTMQMEPNKLDIATLSKRDRADSLNPANTSTLSVRMNLTALISNADWATLQKPGRIKATTETMTETMEIMIETTEITIEIITVIMIEETITTVETNDNLMDPREYVTSMQKEAASTETPVNSLMLIIEDP